MERKRGVGPYFDITRGVMFVCREYVRNAWTLLGNIDLFFVRYASQQFQGGDQAAHI